MGNLKEKVPIRGSLAGTKNEGKEEQRGRKRKNKKDI